MISVLSKSPSVAWLADTDILLPFTKQPCQSSLPGLFFRVISGSPFLYLAFSLVRKRNNSLSAYKALFLIGPKIHSGKSINVFRQISSCLGKYLNVSGQTGFRLCKSVNVLRQTGFNSYKSVNVLGQTSSGLRQYVNVLGQAGFSLYQYVNLLLWPASLFYPPNTEIVYLKSTK